MVEYKEENKPKLDRRTIGDKVLTATMMILSMLMLFSRLFLVTPYDVSGESMMPTLNDGDRLIMKDSVDIVKGDIVVLDSPSNEEEMYIKRVIALGGDNVTIKDGKVYVNGEQLLGEENFGKTLPYDFTIDGDRYMDMEVPEGEVFVLGDNRENSMDSRFFGTVKEETIRGKYWCRILPLNRIGCD